MEALQGDNKGINRKRRLEEASIIRNSQAGKEKVSCQWKNRILKLPGPKPDLSAPGRAGPTKMQEFVGFTPRGSDEKVFRKPRP